jgi:formate dehydrogenase iron-sulfur subunit
VGLEPACVKTCPTGAIVFGTKEDMKEHAAERIVDLKSRGYDNAGLYDPEGVGGTHVMYVLHHADTPALRRPAGPAGDQPAGGLWKASQAAGAAGCAAVLAGFFHYVRVGPQRVEEDEHRRR